MVTFSNNQYYQNFGTGGLGLVDIKGAPRLSFVSENYTMNGDSVSNIYSGNALGSLPINVNSATDMTLSKGFTNTGGAYGPSGLMTSMLNVERTSEVSISTILFNYNWQVENSCSGQRAQAVSFNDFSGQLTITGLTV